jgi:hypothetical protein
VKTLYEKGLRPCITRTLPETALNLPPKYLSEFHNTAGADSRARTRALHSVTLPSSSLAQFASNLRLQLRLNEVEWAKGLFFLHTVCGIKRDTKHRKTRKAARSAWFRALKRAKIPVEATNYGSWWIDVGLEFRSEQGQFLQWITDYHGCIVQEVLGISISTAKRITTLGHHGYSRDIACHLAEVSGCRLEVGIQHGGPSRAAHMELSTTLISGAHHPAVPALTIPQAMETRHQPPQSVIDLFNAFRGQRETQNWLQSNAARIELRVPLKHAEDVLIDIDEDIIRESLVSFSRQEWM